MRSLAGRMLRGLSAVILAGLLTLAHAGSIEPGKAALSTAEDGSTTLNAEFTIDLGPRLEEAVARGVPLYFTLEIELTRPRWWWSNENMVTKTTQYRLSYTALTRQYRLTTGNLHRNFATLDEALRVLSRFVEVPVADKGVLKVGEGYDVGMRLALDRTQLPKPLQVDAIANRDWQVEARVLRWHYVPAAYSPATPATPASPATETRP
ncbi:MAG: DUF4390 domain-containing protein [Rhodocyclaceae bacterium]|nr:DUF4390 domain-containing protein [Rhodocyclaceae bacterium]